MSRIFDIKKRTNEEIIRGLDERSPVMKLIGTEDCGDEWRAVVVFNTKTLVSDGDGDVRREGPVVVGVRYHERFLGEAPHPMEIASVCQPNNIWHPNISPAGSCCLGYPPAGIALDLVIHQLWAAFTFNMKIINTRHGQIVNPEAALYVRANAHRFPITKRGLFEPSDDELKNNHWLFFFDPALRATIIEEFMALPRGDQI
jgi:hypothetical protein